MIRRETMVLLGVLSAVLLLVGCSKKKEDAKAVGAALETTLTKALDEAAKPVDNEEVSGLSNDQIAEKSVELMEKMADLSVKHKSNCDELATQWTKLFEDNAKLIDRIKELNKSQSRDQKKAFNKKYRERNMAVMKKMTPAIEACKDNENLKKAMANTRL